MLLAVGSIMVAVAAANGQTGAAQSSSQPSTVALPDPAAVFDVAAIHLHNPEPHEHNSIWSSPFDGQFRAENVTLKSLVQFAFGIAETRILDGPAWIDSTSFNIDAKAGSSVDAQMRALTSEEGKARKQRMLQALLAERFKLVAHPETRQIPIYALVVAKGGPRLGAIQSNGTTIRTGNGRIEVQGSNSVALLAEELAKVVGRVVVDETGIEGRYGLVVRWTPDSAAAPGFSAGEPTASTFDSSGPSIFTALQEQLGLKLESQKGPVQVLVIDHIEMPSAN
jgi:uncharacterized protein (TIGR03435 family)